jgi:hypothetical protein
MMGDPIVFGAAGAIVAPVFPSSARQRGASLWSLPLMLGMGPMRSELWRVTGAGVQRIASLRGVPQCGQPLGGAAACTVQHFKAVSLYSVTAAGVATEIAQLPVTDAGVVSVGPGLHASSMTVERAMLIIDLAARGLTRIPLPANSQFAAEVRAGPGYLVTLSYAENRRSRVRRYRITE